MIEKASTIALAMLASLAAPAWNPIIHDQFCADPSALVVGDRVYLYPSHDIPAPEDCPRKDWFSMADYHVFSSADLVHWVDHGTILDRKDVPWGDPDAYSLWAPDCAEHDGKYVFFFPDIPRNDNGEGHQVGFRCGTAVADRPEGPYKVREHFIEGVYGIDPCIFKDDDDKGYLVWPSAGSIRICPLNEDWSALEGELIPVPAHPSIPDSIRRNLPPMMMSDRTITVGEVPQKGLVEGPYMFKADGHYYVTFPWARENTEVLAYCMADDIAGPYRFMGVFFDEHENGCWTNHHSIINFKGQWYIFYHHNKYSPHFDKLRSVCIDSLFFEPDGRIRKVTPSLRGAGLSQASEPVEMDRYSAVSPAGASVEYLDTNDCFLGWKAVFREKGAWMRYNAVCFDSSATEKAFVKVLAPAGASFSMLIDGKMAASFRAEPSEKWQMLAAPLEGAGPGIHDITVRSSCSGEFSIDNVRFSDITHCVNPLIYTDIPDNDLIRIGDDYYMVSTTMYFCPGAPIMHSRDLVHWEIVNYVFDCLADDDIYNLREGRNAYGQGQWAASLRYHEGFYYALFSANDQRRTYVYKTDDIENGKWEQTVLERHFHDASLLFDDGHVYLVWGNGDLHLTELKSDVSGVKKGGLDRLLISSPEDGYGLRAEGSHFYHIGDWYYVLEIDWPSGRPRTESCWRSRSLTGPYEKKVILSGRFDGRSDGVAQGGIIDTPGGDWYAIMFQDHGAVGRIPTLQPVKWEDGWPILGDGTFPVKDFYMNLPESGRDYVYADDEFNYSSDSLQLVWQWNHRPDDTLWSVTERPGWLRLKAGEKVAGIMDARNTLTQRTAGPHFTSEVLLDASGMKPGDHAGICAFQSHYCCIGVTVDENGNKYLEAVTREPVRRGFGIGVRDARLESAEEKSVYRVFFSQNKVYLRLHYVFTPENGWKEAVAPLRDAEAWKTGGPDKAYMSFSLDGVLWTEIPVEFKMLYTLDFFTGYRTALYNYSTADSGGAADFDYYHIGLRREPLVPSSAGGLVTGSYRNLFVEAGYSEDEVETKLREVFDDVFTGENRCYFEVGEDEAYISDIKNEDVRTEGMSYGMMIAVQFDRKDIFDRLWRWTRKYMQIKDGPMDGYFRWNCRTDGTANAQGPASDGELYFITSLIFASNRWGNEGEIDYLAEAQHILDCVQPREVEFLGKKHVVSLMDPESGLITFVPGMPFTDPSYHIPAFYEVWARYAEDGRSSYWRDCARRSREYLHKCINPETGLNPDYSNFDGSPLCNGHIIGDAFRYDSWRVPMNIALDYSWSCSDISWQQHYGETFQNFLYSQGLDSFVDQYETDGSKPEELLRAGHYPEKLRHSMGLIATSAAASLLCSHEKSREFIEQLWNTPHKPDKDGFFDAYYDGLLRLFAFMHLSGHYRVIEKTPQLGAYFLPVPDGTPSAAPDSEGFIRRWSLRDPISKPNRSNTVFTDSYLNETFPAPMEMSEKDTAWHRYDSRNYNMKLYRFATCTGQQRYGVIFWVTTVIECDHDMEGVRFGIGSNSASKWWLDGEVAAMLSGDRRMVRDDVVSAPVTLHKGKNVITGAVINGPGMSDFCFRLTDRDGKPVTDVRIK